MGPVCCHPVYRCYCPECYREFIRAFIPHHTDTLNRQQYCARLPDRSVKIMLFEGLCKYLIGFLKKAYFFRIYFTQNPDSKTRTGEWMSLQEFVGDPELLTYTPYL